MTLVNLQGAPQAFSEDDSNVADHNDCQPHDLQAAAWWLLGDRAHVGMEDEGEIGLWMFVMLTGTRGKNLVQNFFSVLFGGQFLF